MHGKTYKLNDDDPNLSVLSHIYEEDGKQITVEIYRDGEGKWLLEILATNGNSLVGEYPFATEQEALADFHKDLMEHGIDFFIREDEDA